MYNSVRLKSIAKLQLSLSVVYYVTGFTRAFGEFGLVHMFLETVLSSVNLQFDL